METTEAGTTGPRPFVYWVIVVFLALSVVLLLAGQTTAVFDYDLTVRLGLQESVEEVGEFGVQYNRAYGVSDTVVYIPLIIISLIGLVLRKRWSLLTTAAVAGISAYWSLTIAFSLRFLSSVPGYSYVPGLEIWIFVGAYAAFGFLALVFLVTRGEVLLR